MAGAARKTPGASNQQRHQLTNSYKLIGEGGAQFVGQRGEVPLSPEVVASGQARIAEKPAAAAPSEQAAVSSVFACRFESFPVISTAWTVDDRTNVTQFRRRCKPAGRRPESADEG